MMHRPTTSVADILLQHRVLFLSGRITPRLAERVIGALMLLATDDSQTPIDLYINSSGGEPASARAIVDAIQTIRPPVRTTCLGQAGGPAVWILAAGQQGRRRAGQRASILLSVEPGPSTTRAITPRAAIDAGIIDAVITPSQCAGMDVEAAKESVLQGDH
jgi:ATP-dependent Clp endopeptidase proteolytic subunit ClpP